MLVTFFTEVQLAREINKTTINNNFPFIKNTFFANVAKIFLIKNFLIFVVVKKSKEKKEKSKEKI
jgi:hypothetical protein